jgi:hypothetical protein
MTSRAIYRITVKGELAENWDDWFNGMIISFEYDSQWYPRTILRFEAKDQSELLGILNWLNSLSLPLLEVNLEIVM